MSEADGFVRLAVAGALGRMGRVVAEVAATRPGMRVAARFDQPEAREEGLVPAETALAVADVAIDFTTAEASTALARRAAERGGPALVIGSTGFDAEQERALEVAARRVVILRSGNFSLGVNVLLGLVRQAARILPARDWDIEIVEAHHRRKLDAPSGTARMLGQAAADGRGVALADVERHSRDGIAGPRPKGEIGFAAIRGGGIVGEHSVIFAAEDEILTLSHSARDRALFARGAVEAAAWAAHQTPGHVYDMQDVLGFGTPSFLH